MENSQHTQIPLDQNSNTEIKENALGQVNHGLELEEVDKTNVKATSNGKSEGVISGDDFEDLIFEPNLVSKIEEKTATLWRILIESLGRGGKLMMSHGVSLVMGIIYFIYFFRFVWVFIYIIPHHI